MKKPIAKTLPDLRWIIAIGSILLIAALIISFPKIAASSTDSTTQMIPATFADVAEKASPAVVNISTVKKPRAGGQFSTPFAPNDPMHEFFERFFGDRMPNQRPQRSLGTGFIIEPSGTIITNNHVVEGADDILVRMSNEKEYKAEIVGRDPKTDIAVIKITTKVELPYLKMGNSDSVRVGDWVVAIGNPFGLEHTVTSGILSARGRAIGAGPYDDFLQTDTSINPGNSGGPLLNLNGEVIGINTAIIASGQGIGFAIPANLAESIISQLKDKGRVVRGWLGVMIQKITPELAKTFKLDEEAGALVADVDPDGPANKGGLKRGDVILKFDGKKVKDSSDLPAIVANTPVGSRVPVDVFRDGENKTIYVTIGELKDDQVASATPAKEKELGITVQELTPQLADRLGLENEKGVVISGIADGSPAAESGLRPGDVIMAINQKPVPNVGAYKKEMRGASKDETVLFLVKRGGTTLFFTVNPN